MVKINEINKHEIVVKIHIALTEDEWDLIEKKAKESLDKLANYGRLDAKQNFYVDERGEPLINWKSVLGGWIQDTIMENLKEGMPPKKDRKK